MMEQMLKGVDFRTFTFIYFCSKVSEEGALIKSYMDLEVQCCMTMHLWVG